MAEAVAPESQGEGTQALTKVDTPNAKSIVDVQVAEYRPYYDSKR